MLTLSNANTFSVLERVGDTELDQGFAGGRASSSVKRGPSRLAGRRWQTREFVSKDSTLKFRIASYNVLAQCYAKPK